MTIINTTVVEAGWSISACIIGGVMVCLAILLLVLSLRAWHSLDFGDKFWCIFSLIFALAIAIGLPLNTRIPISYNKYDILFTEPVDMNEFDAKYTITGKDGNIWHIEDKH